MKNLKGFLKEKLEQTLDNLSNLKTWLSDDEIEKLETQIEKIQDDIINPNNFNDFESINSEIKRLEKIKEEKEQEFLSCLSLYKMKDLIRGTINYIFQIGSFFSIEFDNKYEKHKINFLNDFKRKVLFNAYALDKWIDKQTFEKGIDNYKNWSLDQVLDFIVQNSGKKINISKLQDYIKQNMIN